MCHSAENDFAFVVPIVAIIMPETERERGKGGGERGSGRGGGGKRGNVMCARKGKRRS